MLCLRELTCEGKVQLSTGLVLLLRREAMRHRERQGPFCGQELQADALGQGLHE